MKNSNLIATVIIGYIAVFLVSPYAYGQEEVLTAVSKLKKDVATMEYILNKIEQDVEKDNHKNLEKSGHDFEALLAEIKSTGSIFRDEIRNELNSLTNALASDLVNYEKTVHKSRFLDTHKEFDNDIKALNSDFLDLKNYVNDLSGLVNEVLLTPVVDTVVVYRDREQVPASQNGNPTIEPSSGGEVTSNTYKKSGHSSMGSLKMKSESIGIQMNGIEYAFKYSKFKDIADYCSKISDLCEEMKSLSTDSQLTSSVSEMKEMVHDMEHLALQGHSKHDELHHEFDHLKKLHKKINTHLVSAE